MDGMTVTADAHITADIARAALIFLQRTDIKGGEALVMVQVMRALEACANAGRVGQSGGVSSDA